MAIIETLLAKLAGLLHQQGRMLQVETALPTLSLVPERMVLREAMGQPFEMVLDALSVSAQLAATDLLGHQISVRLLQSDGSYKPWHGYVTHTAQLGSEGGLARYRLVMRPWLTTLDRRADSFVFQDRTAQAIIEDIFSDYPIAQFRFDVSQHQRVRSLCTQFDETDLAFVHRLIAEEGWTYRFEHLEGEAAQQAASQGQAQHVMVIHDRHAELPDVGAMRFTSQHATASVQGQRDAITAFMARQSLQTNAVALGSWNYKQLGGTAATVDSIRPLGEVPRLESYDGAGAYRFEDEAHADQLASLALAALEMDMQRYEGQGSARHFLAGARFTLTEHAVHGVDDSGRFTLLAVEHHATNNLGSDLAQLLASTALERGTYRNHFHAVLADTAVVPRFVRKPTAPRQDTAMVVGVQGEPVTTDRDHRVKVQFGWQRGRVPNPGGLEHAHATEADGNAPGNERSGTWVRVALPSAGANWGSAFTPRVGTEVQIDFLDGDIDRPVVSGQLPNGQDTPPFSAGEDAGVNHPGFISGMHTHRLDSVGDFNQWVVDDAPSQLRMRLMSSFSMTELGLGHLIAQRADSADRGAWRGSGFEAGTQAWATVRGAKGLLVSTTAREGSYGSAAGSQMDVQEAVAQLKAAQDLGQRLGDVARQAGAQAQTAHEAGQAVPHLIAVIDSAQQGKHAGTVNGQAAMQPDGDGRAEGQGVVPAFAQPVIVLETPSTASLATEAGSSTFAGEHLSVVAQGDWHQTAARAHAQASGKTTSLHAVKGGLQAIAAKGPVSLRAHTDELKVLADQQVEVISVNDEIRIQAQSRVEMVGGQSSLVLEGGSITFTCPGQWSAKGATKAFTGGGSAPAELARMPDGRTHVFDEAFALKDPLGQPLANLPFKIKTSSGHVYGVSEQDGATQRIATQTSETLRMELRWFELE